MAKQIECGHHGSKVANLAAQIVRDHGVTEAVEMIVDGSEFRATLMIEPVSAITDLADAPAEADSNQVEE